MAFVDISSFWKPDGITTPTAPLKAAVLMSSQQSAKKFTFLNSVTKLLPQHFSISILQSSLDFLCQCSAATHRPPTNLRPYWLSPIKLLMLEMLTREDKAVWECFTRCQWSDTASFHAAHHKTSFFPAVLNCYLLSPWDEDLFLQKVGQRGTCGKSTGTADNLKASHFPTLFLVSNTA